mgnify:CR=1 FL=1
MTKRHIRNDGTIGYRIGDVIYYGNGRFMNRKTGEKGTYDIRNFYNSRKEYG